MSNNTIQVEVVSNEEKIYSGEALFLVVPTLSGEIGIYPKHTPVMSLVKPGLLRLQVPGQADEIRIAISGGLIEVQPTKVTILSEVAVRSEELDEKRALESKKAAEEKVKNADSDEQRAKAEAALNSAIAQIKAIDYIKNHKPFKVVDYIKKNHKS